MKEVIPVASDHAGVSLKASITGFLKDMGYEVLDLGTSAAESVDYPDYGELVAERVSRGEFERGILICGSGIGMSIVANKFRGVRAALCHTMEAARLSREHNDANILVLGERMVERDLAHEILREWMMTPFSGRRHARRIDKILKIEDRNFAD